MPGILCSVSDPTDSTNMQKWKSGLQLVKHHPQHALEQYSEPGFQLACVYHPEVCQAPRILVTTSHVIAFYGNVYEDDLASGADSEALCRTLLDRFLKDGADALQHLNGRYDIAVWDRHERILYFVSDRFGANRHYFVQRTGELHVACEVKALAPLLDRIEIDPAGLASMLSFGFHIGDLTILRDVRCLPNARRLEYRSAEHQLKIEKYWDYPYGELEPWRESEEELAGKLHGHLVHALKRRLKDVSKVLLPLSGGLDSRAMAGLLAQSGFSGEVLAYSYGQPSSRDVRYGRAIAKKLGYRHVIIPTPDDFMLRHLEQASWRFDAEWSSELNWGPRFSHSHPNLGDTHGYLVLSGMFGDLILGEGAFVGEYRRRAGDAPQPVARLEEVFLACNTEY
ncbi:MAG TPA: asparagine synthase-related protein, partial [Anaerolineae bacterium]|nr:asparagine synthase-related protein [Anaerolineae bacterium]